jgi:bifunctional ADP-heptose synthase (sugar kinase/adenylyltransferase)/beta-phosphoglucomutase-like phosphatase (HAD superfamily)
MDIFRNSNQVKDISVAIIGDICLDVLYRARLSNEISIETGLPVYHVEKSLFIPGGAANIALQCKRLGINNVDLFGIIGEDAYGEKLVNILEKEKIGVDTILVQSDECNTYVYHKIYIELQEKSRFDIGSNNIINDDLIDQLLALLRKRLPTYSCILINQQIPNSIHSPKLIQELRKLMDTTFERVHWIADIREPQDLYPKAIHKMNFNEARQLANTLGLSENSSESAETLSRAFANYWGNKVIITLGENGAVGSDGNNTFIEPGLHIIEDVDPTGAGDAFLAGIAYALGSDLSPPEILKFGNLTAGVFIQKNRFPKGISFDAVRMLNSDIDYRYNHELAGDIRLASYIPDTDIEVVYNKPFSAKKRGYPKVAVFDLDGTVSTLREGWDRIMLQCMIKFITGSHYDSLPKEKLELISNKVKTLIEKTAGVQTIIQMVEMRKLIEEFGYVPRNQIESAYVYKESYANEIRKIAEKKVQRFMAEQLTLEDLTIKGAIPFLKRLNEQGTMIYLASGTDQVDVQRELKALGYDKLFNGGIFGSINDTENDPKKLVMQIICEKISELNQRLSWGDCIIFGDGPVEIREGHKHGFMTVGLISDEKQRFGMNINKRERLILAGADFLIPDYSWIFQLSRYIGWE